MQRDKQSTKDAKAGLGPEKLAKKALLLILELELMLFNLGRKLQKFTSEASKSHA